MASSSKSSSNCSSHASPYSGRLLLQTIHPHRAAAQVSEHLIWGTARGRRFPTLKSSSLDEGDFGDISLRDDFPAPSPVYA